jgi:hypothetical protein
LARLHHRVDLVGCERGRNAFLGDLRGRDVAIGFVVMISSDVANLNNARSARWRVPSVFGLRPRSARSTRNAQVVAGRGFDGTAGGALVRERVERVAALEIRLIVVGERRAARSASTKVARRSAH